MSRAILLTLAAMAIVSTAESAGPVPDKTGFRVYSIGPRCGNRTLIGVYQTVREAARAAGVRRDGSQLNEVTAGTEGAIVPARGEGAVLHTVYSRFCAKSGWQKGLVFGDVAQAHAFAKSSRDKGSEAMIVGDYAPREVYQVYGDQCKAARRALLGSYPNIREALEAAKSLQAKGTSCEVFSGTHGKMPAGTPASYLVYQQGCKGDWSLLAKCADPVKARKEARALRKDDARVEVVRHYQAD